MSNINIARRFESLSNAILSLESEGKLDLTYNRNLALENAKFTDRDNRLRLVFADESNQIWFIVKFRGEKVLNKYSPFSACLSDGPLDTYILRDEENVLIDARLRVPNTASARAACKALGYCISSAN